MGASVEQLAAVKDIGPRIAQGIVNFFSDIHNRNMIDRLRADGLQMVAKEENITHASNLLEGKTFVISGTFAHHSRDEYKALIETHGGKNVGSVSGKTDYIIAGDNMGPAKLEKANKLGIKIISEDDFLRMIGE